MAHVILADEVGIDTSRKAGRFLYEDYYHTFSIAIFQGKSQLGYFDSSLFELGINHSLMYTAKDAVIGNILRHEIAHMMVYLRQEYESDDEENESAHGNAFRNFCAAQNWGEDVFRAKDTVASMNNNATGNQKAERMISKVKKLLRLAESSNPHEAELATVKANTILLRYNLSLIDDNHENDDHCCYVKRILCVKRVNAKFKAISRILTTFYVSPVRHGGDGITYLEVVGTLANVEIAEYIAGFLDTKLDELWQETRKAHPKLKGLAAKNSFLRGVAQGYIAHIKQLKDSLPTAEHHAIMVVEKQLKEMEALAYSSLRSSSSSYRHDPESNTLGKKAGSKLTINKSVSGSKQTPLLT
jgi:hypothetical protein